MQLAVLIYITFATIYFAITTVIAKQDAESRRRRFPRYKGIYKLDYKELAKRAIIFPYDIVRKGRAYTKWRRTDH